MSVGNDPEKDKSYFGYYASLTHQQNMLQDTVRTAAYHTAVTSNAEQFAGKVVLDVGCGSGILSFFAAQAGAARVYAIEAAAPMAEHARRLAKANGYAGIIEVISGKVEDIHDLPEKVDIIISEPMGVLLVHERMIESFLLARDRWLKPGVNSGISPSQMYPSSSGVYFCPFSDTSLYAMVHDKVRFWNTGDFYGVNLSALHPPAIDHFFGQPIVGGFDPKNLVAAPVELDINFTEISITSLHEFKVPLDFLIDTTGICHGLACWFDVKFNGQFHQSVLSTAPDKERTHWHQVRFVFKNPLALNRGQRLLGDALFKVNDQRSYDIQLKMRIQGTNFGVDQTIFLHDQQYWNLSGPVGGDYNLDYVGLYPTEL